MEPFVQPVISRSRSDSRSTVYSSNSTLSSKSSRKSSKSSSTRGTGAITRNPRRSFRSVARTIMIAGIFARQRDALNKKSVPENLNPCHYTWHRDYHSKDFSVPEFAKTINDSDEAKKELEQGQKKRLERVPDISDEMQQVIVDLGKTHLFPKLKTAEENQISKFPEKRKGKVKRKELQASVKKTVVNPNKFIHNTQEAVKYSKRPRTFRQIGEEVMKQQSSIKTWKDFSQINSRDDSNTFIDKVSIENGVKMEKPDTVFEAWSESNQSLLGAQKRKELIEKYLSGSMFLNRTRESEIESTDRKEEVAKNYNYREGSALKYKSHISSTMRNASSLAGKETKRGKKLLRSRTLSTESEKIVYGSSNFDSPPRASSSRSSRSTSSDGEVIGYSSRKKKLVRSRTLSSETESKVFSRDQSLEKDTDELTDIVTLKIGSQHKIKNGFSKSSLIHTKNLGELSYNGLPKL